MKEIGFILHQAKSGKLIVKVSKRLETGAFLLDDRGRKLGRVSELMGPVSSPYASVSLVTGRLGTKGDPVFLSG